MQEYHSLFPPLSSRRTVFSTVDPSMYTTIPLNFPHTNPRQPLIGSPPFPPLPPIHLIQTHLAQPPASLRLCAASRRRRRRRDFTVAGACGAFGGVCRGGRIDVLAIDVLRFRDEGAAAIAPARVPLLEAEELDFLGEEVEDVYHGGGSV